MHFGGSRVHKRANIGRITQATCELKETEIAAVKKALEENEGLLAPMELVARPTPSGDPCFSGEQVYALRRKVSTVTRLG
ncbi:unnamed protein product [Gongylonema pulchrum]|uniref:NET domain-containing protein n=1 Tax=Gongylonema pulchrum TaxID=637853 RepID=A0A183DPK8_9BILA|nr:unnamed protein product [Gongylonema pulchrum]